MALTKEVLALFQGAAQATGGDLDFVGTVAEFVGKGGKIAFNSNNLKNDSKALMMNITTAKGVTGRLFCSKNIAGMIRGKQISLPQLLGLQVVKGETNGGDPILRIVAPQGAEQTLVVNDLAVEEFEVAESKTIASLEDLGF